MVDNHGFRSLVSTLDRCVKMPIRNTIASTHLPNLYEEARGQFIRKLELFRWGSLTTDLWTSKMQISYMALTVHFINEDFLLHSNILSIVVTDHGSSIIKAAVADSGLAHVPCFAHTLNLVVIGAVEKTHFDTNC